MNYSSVWCSGGTAKRHRQIFLPHGGLPSLANVTIFRPISFKILPSAVPVKKTSANRKANTSLSTCRTVLVQSEPRTGLRYFRIQITGTLRKDGEVLWPPMLVMDSGPISWSSKSLWASRSFRFGSQQPFIEGGSFSLHTQKQPAERSRCLGQKPSKNTILCWAHLKASGWMGDSRMRTMTRRGKSTNPPSDSRVTWNTFPL